MHKMTINVLQDLLLVMFKLENLNVTENELGDMEWILYVEL